ncbi:MAG: hypothetical protein H6733_07580 [Alphaproteobacteria bacterium]|nr:hypothetical protein [Alphaproteobacteria bacterium]
MHDDDPIGRALRDLPRARASEDFTDRVLTRVADAVDARDPLAGPTLPTPANRPMPGRTLMAAAAVLLAGLGTGVWWQQAQLAEHAQQLELARLAAEQARLDALHRQEAAQRIAEDRARLDALHQRYQQYQQDLQRLSEGHRSPFLAPGTVGFDLDGRARLLTPGELPQGNDYAPVGYRPAGP